MCTTLEWHRVPAMKIFGGFAGHGLARGVSVDAKTLRRSCDDCGYSWSLEDDVLTKVTHVCGEEPPAKPLEARVVVTAEVISVTPRGR
jgi:hypothetical protein